MKSIKPFIERPLQRLGRFFHSLRIWPARPWAVASLLVGGALLAACSGAGRPDPVDLPAGLSNPLRQVWAIKLPGNVEFPLQVQAQGRNITVASSNGTIFTVQASTGQQIANAQANDRLVAGVGSDGNTTAVVTEKNQLMVFRASQILWHQGLTTQSYTPPLVAGGRVFVLGADRSVFAFDGSNGAQLWHTLPPADSPLVLRQAGVLVPMGNTLVAGLAGRVTGIDPDQGTISWEAPLAVARGTNDVERLVDLVGGVVHTSGGLCARAFQTVVGCVSASGGKVLWSHAANGGTGIAGDDSNIYGAESNGRVLAWKKSTGESLWSSDALQWRYLSGPQVYGSWVAIGDDKGSVLLLNRTDGHLMGRATTDGSAIDVQPVVADNTLIVVTRSGAVYGFRS